MSHGGGAGFSHGGSMGGAVHSAPSFGGGGSAFRGGGGMQFRGSSGLQVRGSGNMGNMNAFRGSVGGNQFRAVSPANRNFTRGNFAQGHFAQTRPFRHGRSVVRFGAPFFYDDYGYYPDSSYSYDDGCYETRRVWTNAGWQYAQVYVCEQ